MTRHLYSPLKALLNASYVTSVLLLTLGAPAGAMIDELDLYSSNTYVTYLWHSRLNHLPDLSRFTQLTKLSLNSNNFRSLDVRALPHLTELRLSHNPISYPTRITGLDQLKELRRLDLVGCPLINLDGISACQNLVSLGLTDTPLTSLRGVESLTHLKELFVVNCPLDRESRQMIEALREKGDFVCDKVLGRLPYEFGWGRDNIDDDKTSKIYMDSVFLKF